MKNIRIFVSENFPFLLVNFLMYLNRHVFLLFGQRDITTNSIDPDQMLQNSTNLAFFIYESTSGKMDLFKLWDKYGRW